MPSRTRSASAANAQAQQNTAANGNANGNPNQPIANEQQPPIVVQDAGTNNGVGSTVQAPLRLVDFLTTEQLALLHQSANSSNKIRLPKPNVSISANPTVAKSKGLTVQEEWKQASSQIISYLQAAGITDTDQYVPFFFSYLTFDAFASYNSVYTARNYVHLPWVDFNVHIQELLGGAKESYHSVANRLSSWDLLARAVKDDSPIFYTYLYEFEKDCGLLPAGTPSELLCEWLVNGLPAPLKYQFIVDPETKEKWRDFPKLKAYLLKHSSAFQDIIVSHKRTQQQQILNSIGTPLPYSHLLLPSENANSSAAPTAVANLSQTASPPRSNYTTVAAVQPMSSPRAPVSVPDNRKRHMQFPNTSYRPNSKPRFNYPHQQQSASQPSAVHRSVRPVWDPVRAIPNRLCSAEPFQDSMYYVAGVTTDPQKRRQFVDAKKCFICQSDGHCAIEQCPKRYDAFRNGTFFYYPAYLHMQFPQKTH